MTQNIQNEVTLLFFVFLIFFFILDDFENII